MDIKISIDIPNARKVLALSSGSPKEYNDFLYNLSDVQIKDCIVKHIKCWGITEVVEDCQERKQ